MAVLGQRLLSRRSTSGGSLLRGLLLQRLTEVEFETLHSEDQHRLGVAVAHCSSGGGTFVVREAGVDPLKTDASSWPASYRSGVAAGLLIDSRGRLALKQQFIGVLSNIVAMMDLEEWRQLSDQAIKAPLDGDLGGDEERRQYLADKLDGSADRLDGPYRACWLELSRAIRMEVSDDD